MTLAGLKTLRWRVVRRRPYGLSRGILYIMKHMEMSGAKFILRDLKIISTWAAMTQR